MAEGKDSTTETFYLGGDGISFTEPDDEVLIWPHQETLGHMIQARKGLYLNPQRGQVSRVDLHYCGTRLFY